MAYVYGRTYKYEHFNVYTRQTNIDHTATDFINTGSYRFYEKYESEKTDE
jgi:hypothetical protein